MHMNYLNLCQPIGANTRILLKRPSIYQSTRYHIAVDLYLQQHRFETLKSRGVAVGDPYEKLPSSPTMIVQNQNNTTELPACLTLLNSVGIGMIVCRLLLKGWRLPTTHGVFGIVFVNALTIM